MRPAFLPPPIAIVATTSLALVEVHRTSFVRALSVALFPKVALALTLLFEAVQQWNRAGEGDAYATQGRYWRERYERELGNDLGNLLG